MPGIKPTQAFMSPANKEFYSEPFARYRRGVTKVNQLAGTKATVELNTMTGNRRREPTQEIRLS